MSWRHRIATVVLFVLAALPVGRTLCAIDCSSTSTLAPHHNARQSCEQPASPAPGPQIEADAGDGCGSHDGDVPQAATTRTERADSANGFAVLIDAIVTRLVTPLTEPSVDDYTAPPGTAPPTTLPLVLRV